MRKVWKEIDKYVYFITVILIILIVVTVAIWPDVFAGWIGAEIEEAMLEFEQEMETWKIRKKNIPFIFTEFGADTLVSEHKLPGVMWTQEYQNKYMEKTFQIFDKFSFIQGELVWNFADFQAQEGIMRVNGNKKGVFTRNRQPKNAAYVIKERWEKI